MNKTKKWTRFLGLVAFAAMASFLAGSAWAQQKTVEEQSAGSNQIQVQLKHSTVVLVEGNHLVTRLEDGRLEAVLIPEDFRFHHNGGTLSVHELEPGMVLTETVTTTERPIIVRTVEIHNGTVWHAAGQDVYIRDENNKVHHLRIPEWATVKINGEEATAFDLRPEMKVNATFITEEPVNVVNRESSMRVHHPAVKAKPAVEEQPAEVKENLNEANETAEQTESETQAEPTELPETASPLPLIGVLGLLSLAASFGLRMARKSL